ncbi:helix-turn-helix domain-containing protein [Streptomyces sp. NPDC087903]|uniref:helix-turn-helix domain-containing protein n=1 Tax=Streptomyces sp. NPDC087903 TaxID=3365819 RepID=UPI0037FE9322
MHPHRAAEEGPARTDRIGRPSVSELAAHWQFADSSHFIRAFRKRHGQTPAQFARSAGATEPRPNAHHRRAPRPPDSAG